jgi:membrane fusion protein (multidrug efflux system)
MSTAFSRTLRLLDADRGRLPLAGLAAGVALLGGWTAWSLLSHVTLYEITPTARLEVDRAIYPIQSPMVGRVTATHLQVGRVVQAGETLVELDSSPERMQVSEERTRVAAIAPQVESLRRQIAAEDQSRTEERQTARIAAEQARANARQAEAPATYNAAEIDRLQKLHEGGLIPERDYQKGRAEAQQTRFTADREQIAVRRIEQEQRTRESDRDSRIRALETEIAKLEGQASSSRAAIQRLENEIDRRVVRAPVAGRLGEASALRIGAVLKEGDRVAAIVPDGRLLVVAQFPARAALGRIAPGQKARVRLDGFPWAQYGTVAATVARVASEIRDGSVRVELAVDDAQPTRIPLQHGLPGSVEVTVEQVTPAALILRTAGRLISSPRERN